ncbi:Leo1-domain-containing protein [Microstroma glucosiphilum]|uniref:Leo1-domain-containing protein n=1 Tax=Pseudomicrostroma glucosiphilum TaxID=1684307 RepID=A0A316UCX1_9BASI|nr:Leo1-domain-containing protein [Pseudomicrostroma glucosiphilum]PWN22728.1 Leo1-domain-containing protein [Pseudomicrostroma glucosiphilum]
MSASPSQTGPAAPREDVQMTTADSPAPAQGSEADDGLFGEEDGDASPSAASQTGVGAGAVADDDDDDDDIRPTARRRKQAAESVSPPPGQKDSAPSGLPTFDDEEEDDDDIFGGGEGSIDREPSAEDQEEAARLAALEYTEDGQPMGARGARSASPAGVATIASISLPHVAQRFTPSHMVRLPHFLRTASSVYEREKYIDEREDAMVREKEEADADEKLRDVERRLRCDNTVRWKLDENGNRVSNSRFVKWSDGSWTLQVGNEQFDVSGFDARYAGSKGASADALQTGSSQSQPTQSETQVKASTSRMPSQPLTYLATADPRSKMLQTLGPLYSNVSIQPASLQSATHRLISSNLSSLRARQAASKVTMSELVIGEKAPEEIKRGRGGGAAEYVER